MDEDHLIFDRRAVRLHRDRASATLGGVSPVLQETAERLLERLDDVTRSFSHALDIGGRGAVATGLKARGVAVTSCDLSPRMASLAGPGSVCADEEVLPFAPASFDLVVANLSLHWVNDLPGALAQIRHVLKPDGLFLASMPVLPTLSGLRETLAETELALRDGVSARVSPFPALRDCAALLQRTGFALPVVDADTLDLRYRTALALLKDLRAAGETNAVRLRDHRTPPLALFPAALAALQARTPEGDSLSVPLHMAVMSAWAPAASQPKPLAPGQFSTSLHDVFGDAASAAPKNGK
ncbi:methyltransferase [Acetobacter nitrogenifigens DSM 23921 = NBRC 105050]|uniref:SAM-dependent methyltransferase n=1 Tax=Acetobacter nitrogenifigens DSM 23921 = NBRC 105050 TaxID=1120919 RepID=A0A511XDC2_9PROT|nr:methyltransferase domain-containing protein [Acetobacter nitrogenifigens]GBQ90168.1 methyltransferase [Acetobacter nitrogenifigens DSM 23921 = NBRC 105050]GEN60885.1 SAM-dependent methyltransferase [Acetobacter nitrogenifigens DSM 23921 = NBRC 105050]